MNIKKTIETKFLVKHSLQKSIVRKFLSYPYIEKNEHKKPIVRKFIVKHIFQKLSKQNFS